MINEIHKPRSVVPGIGSAINRRRFSSLHSQIPLDDVFATPDEDKDGGFTLDQVKI